MTFNFCVYLVKYCGDKLPPKYIGSTSIKKAKSSKYFGSVRSKKWKDIFKSELKNNFHLFSLQILSEHETREQAWAEELRLQKINDVVKSTEYFNESYASINGMFGRDTSGKNNPMYGTTRPECKERMLLNNPAKTKEAKEKIRQSKLGKSTWNKGKTYSSERILVHQVIVDDILNTLHVSILIVKDFRQKHGLSTSAFAKALDRAKRRESIVRIERGKYALKNI
jgi:hypothetical protein